MFRERPKITDEATSLRVLGISLRKFVEMNLKLWREAREAVVRRHEQEWARWMDEARKEAREVMLEEYEGGWKKYIQSYWEKPTPENSVCNIEFRRDETIIRTWAKKPKDYVRMMENIWHDQWDDLDSDFWWDNYWWHVIAAVARLRFGWCGKKADNTSAMIWEIDAEFNREFEARMWPWFDELAAKAANAKGAKPAKRGCARRTAKKKAAPPPPPEEIPCKADVKALVIDAAIKAHKGRTTWGEACDAAAKKHGRWIKHHGLFQLKGGGGFSAEALKKAVKDHNRAKAKSGIRAQGIAPAPRFPFA